MTMLELKPCPHCGNRTKPKVMDWDGAGFPGYEVRCDASGWEGLDERGCGAAGGWGETPDEAGAAWNRRALSTITPAEVGGLVDAQTEARAIVSAALPPHEQAMLGGDAIVVLADLIATALTAERAAHAETKRERDEAIKAAGDQATLRGEAEGKLAASEMAGIVDGWKRRAEAYRTQLDEALKALEPFADIADLIDSETEGMSETDELALHFHDYLMASWPVSLFRAARRALTGGKDDG
jgi:hypothetical protein